MTGPTPNHPLPAISAPREHARPIRVLLFTDTLGDVNGVSRFVRNAADLALARGRGLTIATSTRFALPRQPNIINFPPILAGKMPKYENLELVLPPALAMLRFAREHQPDAIHVSTPGPVGVVGVLAAKLLKVPLLGVYHTDFPAFVEHLFDDEAMVWLSRRAMGAFYRRFDVVLARSESYRGPIASLGIGPRNIQTLHAGIRTADFGPSLRDPGIWRDPRIASGGGVEPETGSSGPFEREQFRLLSVGRVSVEKNLLFLARVWQAADEELRRRDIPASFIVVGDGPYRERMQHELRSTRTHFLGFRHGETLSCLYASGDLFAFPSTTDTLGQVVLEAQCSGLPVLVSDCGGPQSLVRDGITGLVLPAHDLRAWIDAIVTLASDSKRRKSMGLAAHAHVAPMTIERSFDHFWSIHETACASLRNSGGSPGVGSVAGSVI